MAQALRPNTVGSLLATDDRPHPLQDALLAVTAVLGILAFITAQFHSLHLISSWAGLIGIGTGVYGQWVSETTRQRFGMVLGLGASAIGFGLGMAHGGLFGGL